MAPDIINPVIIVNTSVFRDLIHLAQTILHYEKGDLVTVIQLI